MTEDLIFSYICIPHSRPEMKMGNTSYYD